MTQLLSSAFVSACALLSAGIPCSPSYLTGAVPRSPSGREATRNAAPDTNICWASETPTGWVSVTYSRTLACNTSATGPNTKTIRDLSSYKVGESLEICQDQPTPKHWAVIGSRRDLSKCVVYSTFLGNNITTIKRID